MSQDSVKLHIQEKTVTCYVPNSAGGKKGQEENNKASWRYVLSCQLSSFTIISNY